VAYIGDDAMERERTTAREAPGLTEPLEHRSPG
jgi:hypothetical protein